MLEGFTGDLLFEEPEEQYYPIHAGTEGPYGVSKIRADGTTKFYLIGPGCTGYYGHAITKTLDGFITFSDACRAARLMNIAFASGKEVAQEIMRTAMGVK